MAYLLIRSNKVQLWLTQKITGSLTEELQTTVTVKGVDIDWFKKIVLEDVYIEDRKKDTLFYANKLKIDLARFYISKKKIDIDNLILLNANINLVKDLNEPEFNYQYIIDQLSSKDTLDTDTTNSWKINLKGITLINTRLKYKNKNDSTYPSGINFSDLDIKNIHTTITDLVIGDTIKGTLKHFSLIEKSGFGLKDVSCKGIISSSKMQFDDLKINTPYSRIITNELLFSYKSYNDFDDFIEKVKFKSKFEKTKINLKDIAYFSTELSGINQTIDFEGNINGSISDLKGKNIDIFFGKHSRFQGDINLTGLPNIEETFIHLNVKALQTLKSDLEQIPLYPFDKKEKLKLPDNIGMLGLIKYKGSFTGFYNDFVTYGNFSTSIGNISSDISMQKNKTGQFAYLGKINASNFNIGKFFFINEYMGNISLSASIDGKELNENATGSIKGLINSIEFNGYNYQNVSIEGKLSKKIFTGFLAISDENIGLDFNGNIDFSKQTPVFDFESTIKHANLNTLHFSKNNTSRISGNIAVNATGDNFDNLLGFIDIKNLKYEQDKNNYLLNGFNLTIEKEDEEKILLLKSDIADGKIKGNYNFSQLKETVNTFLSKYIPSQTPVENKKTIPIQDFNFSITIKKTRDLSELFFPQLSLTPNTIIKGEFNSGKNIVNIRINSPGIQLAGIELKNTDITVSNLFQSIDTRLTCNKLIFNDTMWVDSLTIHTQTQNDSSLVAAKWTNNTRQKHQSTLNALFSFSGNETRLSIKPSDIYILDSLWTINEPNETIIDSAQIITKGIRFTHENQQMKLEGTLSKNKIDQLIFSVSHFNLSYINIFTKQISSSFKGTLSGNIFISDFYQNPIFSSNLTFDKLYLNEEFIGNGAINSKWDKENNIIHLNGSFTRGVIPNIEFKGLYHLSKKENNIDIHLNLEAMRLQFFEEYIKEYCSDFKGQFSGKVNIKGSLAQPLISGKINVQAKKIKVNYLNTIYSFASDITIGDNYFGVDNLQLFDQISNTAMVSGKVYHENFKKFQLDVDINTQKFMCLNTTEALNNLYFGKAFASGIINIFGYSNNLTIDANIKTEKGTQINIPLSSAQEITETNFITFIKKEADSSRINDEPYKVKLDGLKLNFNIDINPEAEVLLIFDSKIGDIIRGRGNGNLKMTINTLGNFNMYGNYTIESGDYLFTLKNIINKKFDIEKGGTIKWSGNPYNAEINLTAVYRLKASLYPFFPTDVSGIYKRRYPVSCKLLLSDQLLKPTINFDIDLPTVDESTKQIAKDYMKTEQDLNEQVFSLLLLNSFVTPSALRNLGVTENTGGPSAGATTSSELLSNQLTNMLSRVSNDFDVGVRYRPGDEITSQQVEVALSTQLFNDRVSIDGSVGVAGDGTEENSQQTNTNSIVGDVNIEYKISPDGKLRVKAFNKSNDNTLIINNGPYTQGAGIAYREEFNTLEELYLRYLSKLKKNEKEQ